MRDHLAQRLKNECGAVLAITAVIAGVLLLFFFTLAVDAGRIKTAAIDLRAKTDMICKAAAYEPMWQTEAVATFNRLVGLLPDQLSYNTTIEKANIIIPAMAGAEAFGGGAYSCPTGGICQAYGNINHSDGPFPFPSSMWDQDLSVGNVVACEIEAKVGTLIGGTLPNFGVLGKERTIRATSAWSRPVYSASPLSYLSYLEGAQAHQMPALTIAIAPQMTTRKDDQRFLFDDSDESYFEPYDPIRLTDRFEAPSQGHVYLPNELSVMPAAAIDDQDLLEEMLVACMNPAVLVRNTFLSMIVELSARHGFLRDNTEILNLNPRSISEHPEFNYVAPALIVQHGEDLASRNFQHPFTFYPVGTAGDPAIDPGAGAQPKGLEYSSDVIADSLLNPFWYGANESATEHPFNWHTAPELIAHHSLVAGQLRFCNHLYDRGVPSGWEDPIERFAIDELEGPGYFLPQSDGFALPGTLAWPAYAGEGSSWDRANPWGDCSSSGCLTAGEVVATLGSVQSCPYQEPVGVAPLDPICQKPVDPYTDLEGDLRSFFEYLADNAAKAILSPGLFPIDLDSDKQLFDDKYPFAPQHYDGLDTKNIYSHILLVLHKPPNAADLGEIEQLISGEDGLNDNANRVRPITIIYLPTHSEEGNIDTSWAASFGAVEDVDATTQEANRLYVFSPYEHIHSDDGDACAGADELEFCVSDYDTESEQFQAYWQYLLTPGHRYSIVSRAREIFLERILVEKFKL